MKPFSVVGEINFSLYDKVYYLKFIVHYGRFMSIK